MTKEEAVLILTRLEKGCDEYAELTNYAKEALQMALTALSAQTDGDVISRQAAIDALKPLPTIEGLSLQPLITVDDVIKVLNGLPSAQPERDKPVKPIETTDRAWGIPHRQAVCPKCDYYLGHVVFLGDGKGKRITYCETCGQAIDWEGWDFDE